MFARRRAAHVVAGEPLQGVGLPRPQLVGVDDGAVRGRRGRVRVVEVGLVGVSGPRAGGDGGQRAVLGHHVRARVALGPRHALGGLGVFPWGGGENPESR